MKPRSLLIGLTLMGPLLLPGLASAPAWAVPHRASQGLRKRQLALQAYDKGPTNAPAPEPEYRFLRQSLDEIDARLEEVIHQYEMEVEGLLAQGKPASPWLVHSFEVLLTAFDSLRRAEFADTFSEDMQMEWNRIEALGRALSAYLGPEARARVLTPLPGWSPTAPWSPQQARPLERTRTVR